MNFVFVKDCTVDGCYRNNVGGGKQMCREHEDAYDRGEKLTAFYGRTVQKSPHTLTPEPLEARVAELPKLVIPDSEVAPTAETSYALRNPETGSYWRFMTSLTEWEAATRGEGGTLWQSDTPVSLTFDEAEIYNEFQMDVLGNDPLEIVQVVGPPTHRFLPDEDQPGVEDPRFWPQLERIVRRCPETLELFEVVR